MRRRRGGGARERWIGVPLRVLVVRVLRLAVGMRGRVLWWRGEEGAGTRSCERLQSPSGSLHNG